MWAPFAGERAVVSSGGETAGVDSPYETARDTHDGGGNGSISGRNTFQRQEEQALGMLNKIIDINPGKA